MKIINRLLSGVLTLNVALGAGFQSFAASPNAGKLERLLAQYETARTEISKEGSDAGLRALNLNLGASDKALFQSAIRELGNLPEMKMADTGVHLIAGNRKILVEFLTTGEVRVGGYTLSISKDETLQSITAKLERAQNSLQYSQIEQSLFESALNTLIPEAQAAGWGMWLLAIGAAVLAGWAIFKIGKDKGKEEAIEDYAAENQGRHYFYESHHGGGYGHPRPHHVPVDDDRVTQEYEAEETK